MVALDFNEMSSCDFEEAEELNVFRGSKFPESKTTKALLLEVGITSVFLYSEACAGQSVAVESES